MEGESGVSGLACCVGVECWGVDAAEDEEPNMLSSLRVCMMGSVSDMLSSPISCSSAARSERGEETAAMLAAAVGERHMGTTVLDGMVEVQL